MIPFRNILFPVDYSPACQAVLPYVREMKRHFSAELTLVHAYGPEALAFSPLPITDPELPEAARTNEQWRLREFAGESFPGEHIELFAELGDPAEAIHKLIQHQGADLVMLPTHGFSPVRQFLLGSVTAKILHEVTTPVWTGTDRIFKDHAPQIPYKSILCALDESDEADGVLMAAAAIAGSYQAGLQLIQVVEIPPAAMELDFNAFQADLMNAADFRLRELKGRLGIRAAHAVLDGSVAGALRQEAVRVKADLIVTGRGRVQNRLSRVWSHLQQIFRESPCPVLSI